jgi:hypothetical protein
VPKDATIPDDATKPFVIDVPSIIAPLDRLGRARTYKNRADGRDNTFGNRSKYRTVPL